MVANCHGRAGPVAPRVASLPQRILVVSTVEEAERQPRPRGLATYHDMLARTTFGIPPAVEDVTLQPSRGSI